MLFDETLQLSEKLSQSIALLALESTKTSIVYYFNNYNYTLNYTKKYAN